MIEPLPLPSLQGASILEYAAQLPIGHRLKQYAGLKTAVVIKDRGEYRVRGFASGESPHDLVKDSSVVTFYRGVSQDFCILLSGYLASRDPKLPLGDIHLEDFLTLYFS